MKQRVGIRLDLNQFLQLAKDAHMVPRTSSVGSTQLASVCLPINMPYADAAAMAGTRTVPFAGD